MANVDIPRLNALQSFMNVYTKPGATPSWYLTNADTKNLPGYELGAGNPNARPEDWFLKDTKSKVKGGVL